MNWMHRCVTLGALLAAMIPRAAGATTCPENPTGGPNRIHLAVSHDGSDVDIGFTGAFHNRTLPDGSTVDLCISGCEGENATDCRVSGVDLRSSTDGAFLPPLPLIASGVPLCIVTRVTAGGAQGQVSLATGAMSVDLRATAEVHLTSTTGVCPTCDAGVCTGGPRDGQACVPDALTPSVSRDCLPDQALARLPLRLPLSTGAITLAGPHPCASTKDDPLVDDVCSGRCDAECSGSACVTRTTDGTCIDEAGGLSQTCCSGDTQRPCFPTSLAAGGILARQGSSAVPTPIDEEAGSPQRSAMTLASVACLPRTGSLTLDSVLGLPGPVALLIPGQAEWRIGPDADFTVESHRLSLAVRCQGLPDEQSRGGTCEAVAVPAAGSMSAAFTSVRVRKLGRRAQVRIPLAMTPAARELLRLTGVLRGEVRVRLRNEAGQTVATGSHPFLLHRARRAR